MAKFITVLNSNLQLKFWKAVQWAETLQELRTNNFFTSGVNLSLPKSDDDVSVEGKTVTETATGKTASATIIRLAAHSVNIVNLSATKAPASFIKKVEKSLK